MKAGLLNFINSNDMAKKHLRAANEKEGKREKEKKL
jgi:hypothetical protein